MTVYIDKPRKVKFRGKVVSTAHLMADTEEELHNFASQFGLRREWFQNHPTHPHYDVFEWYGRLNKILQVLTPISSKEMLRKFK